jgi:hypothetical protein
MIMAYRDKRDVDILISQDTKESANNFLILILNACLNWRPENTSFKNRMYCISFHGWQVRMLKHNQIPYLLENMQPSWLRENRIIQYKLIFGLAGW